MVTGRDTIANLKSGLESATWLFSFYKDEIKVQRGFTPC